MKSWLITFTVIFLIFAFTIVAHAGGKIYEPQDPKYGTKKQYTNQQRINRGINDKQKKYTTCRLMKRLKSRVTKRQACIYIGGNKTYTLMYEDNCPSQYKCEYNPWSKEPSIDDIVDSLNSIKKQETLMIGEERYCGYCGCRCHCYSDGCSCGCGDCECHNYKDEDQINKEYQNKRDDI